MNRKCECERVDFDREKLGEDKVKFTLYLGASASPISFFACDRRLSVSSSQITFGQIRW